MGEIGIKMDSKFLGWSNWKAAHSHYLRRAGDGWELGEVQALGFGHVCWRHPSGDLREVVEEARAGAGRT